MRRPRLTGNHARDYQRTRYRSLDQAWVNWREQRIVTRLLTDCHIAGGSLLDVPCGYGRFAPVFARLGIKVIGADVEADMVRLAGQNLAPHGHGRGVSANVSTLPFADNTFDCVFCIRLLHHRHSDTERLQICRELARVSRRFVLISCYQFTSLHELMRYCRGTRGRLRMMTRSQLQELAEASGLHIQSVSFLLRYVHMQTFVVLTKTGAPHRDQAAEQPV